MGKLQPVALVAAYLDRLLEIHSTQRQTPELSYRAALENLLNAIGAALDPAVQATGELADTGAGHPDFGFFEVRSGNARGGVEVKSPGEDVPETADGSQVSRYVNQYGYVLVSKYRDFLLVTKGQNAKPIVEGRCTLAPTAEAFWRSKPHALAKDKGEELTDFLVSVIKRSAPITRPADLADDLARHAREAKRRLARHDISALAPLKEAMEKALGLHFAGKEGEDFFRSSLVQTLFYGLFSGWMLWRESRVTPSVAFVRSSGFSRSADQPPKGGTTNKDPSPSALAQSPEFDWKDASEYLALPLVGNLYEEIARPRKLADLGLRDPLDWSTSSLNRVDEAAFFRNFDQTHAITLFYEPFLAAFDPELRKQLGVWFTPPEIVQYMVGRVDQLLRSELGIENGLADGNVYVLDPCCGTASYLLEVARKIHGTLVEQGHGQLAVAETKKALTTRIFGFEILPAPYVVSHLQLGILLRQIGTKLAPSQRAGVYLTNALTGWEPPKGAKGTLAFQFLQEEQEAAEKVKRETPILVILGNPPYNRFAGVAEDEEADLIQPYKEGLYEKWNVRKQLLDDLYIRFFRLAEKRIAEVGGAGVVCYISNYSWLDGLSHPIMRERLLSSFDRVWIDNLNGDKYKTGKRTPDGKPDESMFTTDDHPVGIQVGTAIASLVKQKGTAGGGMAVVHYRDLWGFANEKRKQLLADIQTPADEKGYATAAPSAELRFSLSRGGSVTSYTAWPGIDEVFNERYMGVHTGKDEVLISIDREPLLERFRAYYDPTVSDDALREDHAKLVTDANRFDGRKIRQALLAGSSYSEAKARPILYRPFDPRYVWYEETTKLVQEKGLAFYRQTLRPNTFLVACPKSRLGGFTAPLICSTLGGLSLLDPGANFFPVAVTNSSLRGEHTEPNVRPELLAAVATSRNVAVYEGDGHTYTPAAMKLAEDLFYHILAILWSPAYRKENEAALRQDWPRVPIPADAAVLAASAKLGRAVADLLLPDKPVAGVTTGNLRPELRRLAVPTKVGGTPIEEPADTKVDAGWGFRGQKNAVMCGKGKVTASASAPGEPVVEDSVGQTFLSVTGRAAGHIPVPPERPAARQAGMPAVTDKNVCPTVQAKTDRNVCPTIPPSLDIWINDRVYWHNVPADVWAMTIGGYPVVKKWLSYREHKVLGRALSGEELTYITQVVRRLKALLMLGGELDANYRAAAGAAQVK